MRNIRALMLTLFPTAALAGDDTFFMGEGTSYTLGQVSAGNCNFMYGPGVGEKYAALNNEQWDSTRNCGRCAEVSCDDPRCRNTTSSELVYLIDRCPECKEGDLDLSASVFTKLTGSDVTRHNIKWKFVDCPVSGNVAYCTKSGSSSSWLAIQPTNFATGIAKIKIANQDVTMVDSCYYFLLQGGTNVDMSAVNLELTSVAGETIFDTLKLSADNCTEGTSNFGASSSGVSETTQSTMATTMPEQNEVYDSLTPVKSNEPIGDARFKAGAVVAANESGTKVSILQSREADVEKTSSTEQTDQVNELETTEMGATYIATKSEDTSSDTSPVLTALIVIAAVACIALAAVVFSVKRKNLNDKCIDQAEGLMRAFDTFSSPVRITERIAKL